MEESIYHITPTKNLPSIRKIGLHPHQNAEMGDAPGVYFFVDRESAEEALYNWAGDKFDDEEPLSMLKVSSEGLNLHSDPAVGYEVWSSDPVPPRNIQSVESLDESLTWSGHELSYNDLDEGTQTLLSHLSFFSAPKGRFSRALNQAALDGASSNGAAPFYRGVTQANLHAPMRPNAMGLVFVTPDLQEARMFAGFHGQVFGVEVQTDNVFEGWNPEHLVKIGREPDDVNDLRLFDSAYVETPFWIDLIKGAGFDGFYVRDYPMHPQGFMNIALFGDSKAHIRSSLE